MSELLCVEALSVVFSTSRGELRALDSVDLAVPRGGAMALVGESGSGKSTVILALLGLLGSARVSAARLSFDGSDLRSSAAVLRGRRMAVVFQDPSSSLNPALTVGAQVSEPLRVHTNFGKREASERATELLAEVGLPRPTTLMGSYPHQLSGGMKQRVAIAMALAAQPDLLLLDEPTTALDVTVEAGILDLLARLRAERNLTLLLVSHNLGIVNSLCDEATVLYAGRVVERGTVTDVLHAAKHPYTRGLLAAVPRREHDGPLVPIPGALPDLTNLDLGCNFRQRCYLATPGCEAPQTLSDGRRAIRCWRVATLESPPEPTRPSRPARAASKGTLVAARDLSRRFGAVHAVESASLTVAPGEVLGLVGESGSGKSTLGRLLLRLLSADAGDLLFDGVSVPASPTSAFRRRAQIVLQNPDTALNPRHTVGNILRRPLVQFGLARRAAADQEVARLLEMVRLAPSYAKRYPHQLSGGEKQRVGIARALASRPDFVVCDEAVSALDVSVQAAILNLLADLRSELGLALLFISHDMGVIAHISDRIAVMYGGTVMEEGATLTVMDPPYHPYTEALLSAVPSLNGPREGRLTLSGEPGAVSVGGGCRFSLRCPRRLGRVCDEVAPPWRELSAGHHIRCHIPPAELTRTGVPTSGLSPTEA